MSREPQGIIKSNARQQQLPCQNNDLIGETTIEALEVIREETCTPTASSVRMVASKPTAPAVLKCICRKYDKATKANGTKEEEIETLLKNKEAELRKEYENILKKEIASMKERFDYILINEQTRASYKLLEAHKERQEKINALKTQLECKNLAALMYVMCSERQRSKLEKLRIIRDYSNYIRGLQAILKEGQELILHLSRGYKTAARVNNEWREKMKKVISEFMAFIYNFAGGSPESNQYFFDVPALLKIKSPLVDDPSEDPCEEEDVEEKPPQELPREKSWWERLDGDHRPFVVYGDLGEFKPSQRREVLKSVKAAKTAPKKWKQYAFNEMSLNSPCSKADKIKDLYVKRLPVPGPWECIRSITSPDNKDHKGDSKQSLMYLNWKTGPSFDIRGNMGSLLKIITSANVPRLSTKTALLGARDSIELTSATKLRERASLKPEDVSLPKDVTLDIGRKRVSVFDSRVGFNTSSMEMDAEEKPFNHITHYEDEESDESESVLGSLHTNSLHVIPNHVPDKDHKIYYERVCPTEQCQRMQMDSFMRTLPPYMRANPFEHFEMTYDQYETCTPEQLEMLKQRIETKKGKAPAEFDVGLESPMQEWLGRGVAVQTSELSLSLPCTCHVPSPTPISSNFAFSLEDLLPVKQAMDAIHQDFLYNKGIDFDRFKVVGQDSNHNKSDDPKKELKHDVRYNEIRKILKQHPSLLDLFQANTQC